MADNEYLSKLADEAGGYKGVISDPGPVRDFLVHALQQDAGVIFYEPGATVPLSRVRFVNKALLDLLNYADQTAYATALTAPGFVHADDLEVVEDHIRHASSAVYDARLLRGNAPTYRKCRIQGMSFRQPGTTANVLRVTIIRAAP